MARKDDPTGPEAQDWPQPESAVQRSFSQRTREQLRATLKEREPIKAEKALPQDSFPDDAEIEYERSVIRIPFYLKDQAARADRDIDVMAFDAYMRLIREAPVRNGIGLRQFEFYIDAWELTNTFSAGLNSDVTFTLSDTVQPKSLCVALQRESDFPAMIVYNAIYDVYLGRERIIEGQAGVAMATPVREIPPRNVTVAFEKPFESDQFAFRAGTCEGMLSITSEEFEAGVTQALQIRGQA